MGTNRPVSTPDPLMIDPNLIAIITISALSLPQVSLPLSDFHVHLHVHMVHGTNFPLSISPLLSVFLSPCVSIGMKNNTAHFWHIIMTEM